MNNSQSNLKNNFQQAGQTLIETVVAIFILVMGIVAALGLAIYALNASTNLTKQIVAVGLAREGLEAVRNMRDTNWLKLALDNDCYDYVTTNEDAHCYKDWLDHGGTWNNSGNDRGYKMDPGGTTSYLLTVDSNTSNKFWNLQQESQNKWGLDAASGNTDISGSSFAGLFVNNDKANGTSDFYRKIILQADTNPPFDQNIGPRLLVTAQVWWVDKRCPRVQSYDAAQATCKLQLQTYLTNWKTY